MQYIYSALKPSDSDLTCVFYLQLLAKSYTTTSEAELEKRVRALTENLIQKQTVIEALSTEKSSLVLQLERLEVGQIVSQVLS